MSRENNRKTSPPVIDSFWSALAQKIRTFPRRARVGHSSSGEHSEVKLTRPSEDSLISTFQEKPFESDYASRFELSNHGDQADHYFSRLRRSIFRRLDVDRTRNRFGVISQPQMFRESGSLDGQRKYFYLKNHGEPGWLFERAGHGWVVSRCEKILSSGTFIRRSSAFDIVNLYSAIDGNGPPRIKSHRTNGEIISFVVYEGMVHQNLGMIGD